MSSTERFTVFMELRIPQFYRLGELGIPSIDHERLSTATGEFIKVSIIAIQFYVAVAGIIIIISMLKNVVVVILCYRYGIRVDPFQWFVVLSGRDEGSGVPSIILLACKAFDANR